MEPTLAEETTGLGEESKEVQRLREKRFNV